MERERHRERDKYHSIRDDRSHRERNEKDRDRSDRKRTHRDRSRDRKSVSLTSNLLTKLKVTNYQICAKLSMYTQPAYILCSRLTRWP